MSKAREEAERLINLMSSQTYTYQPYAGAHQQEEEIGDEAGKKCALICVDMIMNVEMYDITGGRQMLHKEYWQEVKQELNTL